MLFKLGFATVRASTADCMIWRLVLHGCFSCTLWILRNVANVAMHASWFALANGY